MNINLKELEEDMMKEETEVREVLKENIILASAVTQIPLEKVLLFFGMARLSEDLETEEHDKVEIMTSLIQLYVAWEMQNDIGKEILNKEAFARIHSSAVSAFKDIIPSFFNPDEGKIKWCNKSVEMEKSE